MKVLALRPTLDGLHVTPATRMRPVACPPPSTVAEVYKAGQDLLGFAYVCDVVVTREGTPAHQGAVALEHMFLMHYERESDGKPGVHEWSITELGRYEYEHKRAAP